MSRRFPHLTSPIQIASLQLKNRLVMSPMTTAYCNDDQTPNDRLIAYFEERAKGGVGLIITELITTDVVHRYLHRSMTLGEDKYIEHHRRLTDAIHQHGAKVLPQLSHTGPESVAPMFGGPQGIGPSVNVAPVWGWASRPLEIAELPAIAAQYGEAARRAREAGYDGIELHAAHCYNLLASFLSPLRNKRSDEYAAFKAETRTRFIKEVLAEIKSRAGSDFPIVLSISGYERFPGGRALDDTQRLAPELVAAGVDGFRVSGGISDSLVTMMVNRTEHGVALNVAQAEAIRNVVDVPVMLVGRVHDPELAERIIADGQADLIAMARPLLADAFLPQKVIEDRPHAIRRCISCENCIDSMQSNDNLACAINPFAGRELELQIKAGNKKVVVVGGGTAGMEAARLACEAGHRVVLFEKQHRLGGSLWLASALHKDNERFYHWLRSEVESLPIDIRKGSIADRRMIEAEQPDAVIIATGAIISTPDIPGVQQAQVLTGALMRQIAAGELQGSEIWRLPKWQRYLLRKLIPRLQPLLSPGLLRSISRWWVPLDDEIVIVGADLASVELAEFLAQRGRKVHIVDAGNKICPEVGKKRRNEHMDRLDRLKITVNTSVSIERIETDGVVISVAGAQHKIAGDEVIVAGLVQTNTSLADEISDMGIDVFPIGDCNGLGLIAKATHSAAEAVSRL